MADYGDMFYGTLPEDTQDFRQVLAGIGRTLRDRAIAAGQRIGQSGQEAIALQNQAFADPRRPTKVTDEAALARLTDMIMAGPMGFAPAGITAYHGSPYLFRMFNPAKVGTGEGAQAYGVGAGYTAEVRDIGESYRDVLASPRNQAMSGRGVYIEPSPMGDKTWRIAQPDQMLGGKAIGRTGDATQGLTDYEFKNVASAIKYAKKKGWLDKNQKINLTEIAEEGKYNPVRSASQMENPLYNQLIASEQGYLYKGDIPDELIPKFLDWDKPIKEQSQEVQKLAKQYKLSMNDLGGDLVGAVGKTVEGSKIMEDAGIRGIKYLDANSRNAKYGSQNFIPFRPEDYKIQEINDIPIEEWIRRGLLD